MTMDELKEFAKQQMQIYTNLRDSNPSSEADAIEKLVVPLLQKLYERPLYFERASRAGRGAGIGKWDLEVYDHSPTEKRQDRMLLIAGECKNIRALFCASKTKAGDSWGYKKTLKLEGERTVKDLINEYINSFENTSDSKNSGTKVSINTQGDRLLQVWIYRNCPKYKAYKNDNVKIIWTNGITWVVFENDFFSGDNPPNDIVFGEKGTVVDSKGHFTSIVFPTNDAAGSIDEWCNKFEALRAKLISRKILK